MLKKIATAGLYLLALVLICWTGYRTTHLLSLTVSSLIVPFLGLAVFDGGLIVWTYYFLHGAEGTAQRAVALCAGLLNLALVMASTAADVWLGGQTLADVPKNWGALSLWLIAGATAVNLALMWLAHVTDPMALREMRLRDAKDKILDEAYRQLKVKTDEMAAQVADTVSGEMMDDAVRALIGNARQSGAAPRPLRSQPMDAASLQPAPVASPINEAITDILSRSEDELPTGGYPAARPPAKSRRNGHKEVQPNPK